MDHWRNQKTPRDKGPWKHKDPRPVVFLVALSLPTLETPQTSLPGSSVHEILQAWILGWVAISFSRGSSWPGIEPKSPALQADSLLTELQGKPENQWDVAKAIQRGKFMAIQSYLKKQEKFQINNLMLHLKQLEKEETKPKSHSRERNHKNQSRNK